MRTRSWILLGAVLVAGVAVSGVLSPANQYTGVTILTAMIIALAWNIVAGYSGQLSLGVAAFVGLGGYAGGLLMAHAGFGWIPAAIATTGLSAVFAFLLGLPLLRLRGAYFAVGTLAAAAALQAGAQLWTWIGGGSGFTLPVDGLPSSVSLLRASVVGFVIALAAVLYVKESPFGLRVVAVRDDERAATALGISCLGHRLAAFVISGALTGLAGALVALQTLTVSPSGSFSLSWTINATLYVVAGGIATITGPLIGVIVVYLILTQELQNLGAVSAIIEGALLIVILRFAPGGLWPALQTAAVRARRRLRPLSSEPGPVALAGIKVTANQATKEPQ
jgi:branched-chain amino acid transport system permease protein